MSATGEFNQVHCSCVPWLEAHGGSRGDIQAEAAGGYPVKIQLWVDLGEMVVRSDLDGAVPVVDQVQDAGFELSVAEHGFITQDVFSRFHVLFSLA